MLSQFEPNVKAVIAFLKFLGIKVNNTTVDETMQSHPDWPSLLCVSDSLTKWNIPNGAAKIDPIKIDELPTPFIAFTHSIQAPIAIIAEVSSDSIKKLQGNYNKPYIISKDEFFKIWDGTYLIAEPNESSGESGYKKIKINSFLRSLIPIAAILLLATVSLWSLSKNIFLSDIENQTTVPGIFIQFLITIIGTGVSVLLLWYEIDQNNPLLHKVCTSIKKGNCGAILTGKASKVFSWLSWSEVGFFYYAGAILSFVFAGTYLPNTVSLIALFNLMALVYPFYSIYYQWRIAKEWCIFCLTVQGLLVLGAINIFSFGLLSIKLLTIPFLLQSFVLYITPVLIWFSIKPFILKLQEAKFNRRDYQRLKFNTEVFDTLLKKQKQIITPVDGLGIDIGNPNAGHTLVKVCNPYCGPCAKAHLKIERLITGNANIKAKVIFTATTDEKDYRTVVVQHLMAIASQNNGQHTAQALDDWYLADKKDYKNFAEKYPLNGAIAQQTDAIKKMEKWCEKNKIVATPTIFINGYQLPDVYDIGDLEYFLLE